MSLKNDVDDVLIMTLFCVAGAFDNGLAEGVIEEALKPISAMRLVFQSDAVFWAILNEVCCFLLCFLFFQIECA